MKDGKKVAATDSTKSKATESHHEGGKMIDRLVDKRSRRQLDAQPFARKVWAMQDFFVKNDVDARRIARKKVRV